MRRYLLFLLAVLGITLSVRAQIGIGQWRDHLSYSNVHSLAYSGHRYYAASNQGIFYFDNSQDVVGRLNKTNGLSDVGIATMAFHRLSGNLVIAYTNGNVDIYNEAEDKVYNVPGIKLGNISGSKQINKIVFFHQRAFLACDFGIVKINLDRHEIEDTYYIGVDGSHLKVNDLFVEEISDLIFAATQEGLMAASATDQFLNIRSHWTTDSTSPLAGQPVLAVFGNALGLGVMVEAVDDIREFYRYHLVDGQFQAYDLVPALSGKFSSFEYTGKEIMLCCSDGIRIYKFEPDSVIQIDSLIGSIDWLPLHPNCVIQTEQELNLLIGTDWYGMALVDHTSGKLSTYQPTGPATDNVYRLTSFRDKVYACPGGKSSTYTSAYLGANVYTFQQEHWRQLLPNTLLDTLHDIVDVAINPRDTSMLLAASWGHGLLDIRSNIPTTLYNQANTQGTLLPYTQGDYSSLRTGGVTFDKKGNAWITNSLQTHGLVERTAEGQWKAFSTQSMVGNNEVDHVLCDSVRGYVWFYGRGNRIFVHDGVDKMAYVDPNYGSKMETSDVTCMVQDHDGDLWIGTNKGLKLINGAYKAFNNGGQGEKSPITCLNIIISQGDIAEYLMAYESVTCMTVDGANRKWVGTSTGGLYLISDNGLSELQHFTASNSPLFSDKIVSLAVHPLTGELFIGTDKGLQSYRSTATYATGINSNEIYAFPNPVRPDYSGPIAIKGFSRNALIHITDASGRVVFTSKASGGQAVWNGKTNQGDAVESGIYFVFASNENGDMRAVTKVMIIR